MNMTIFDQKMQQDGWCIFEDVLPERLIADMRSDCLKWVDVCKEHQIRAGINEHGDGTAHHSVGAGDSIDEFLNLHLLHPYLAHFFNDFPYILHACNPVGGFPKYDTYIHKIHRDINTFIPNFNVRTNMLVMLDDFTVDNGATKMLRGSHTQREKPSEEMFKECSEPLLGKAGSIVLFNSYLWHKGGFNRTDRNRVALTLSFGLAFIKPQMDYARYLGDKRGAELSELSRQVFGYNARVPTTLDEWYTPKEERLYHVDQG